MIWSAFLEPYCYRVTMAFINRQHTVSCGWPVVALATVFSLHFSPGQQCQWTFKLCLQPVVELGARQAWQELSQNALSLVIQSSSDSPFVAWEHPAPPKPCCAVVSITQPLRGNNMAVLTLAFPTPLRLASIMCCCLWTEACRTALPRIKCGRCMH